MSRAVLIIGGGGHAKVLIDALRLNSVGIAGILDADPSRAGSTVAGVPVVGDDSVIGRFDAGQVELVNAVGSTGVPTARRRVFEEYKRRGYSFASVVHPSAVIAADVHLGEGVQIMAGAVIQPGCRIGKNTIVNTRASVDHDCGIGDHVHLAPGVTLSGGATVGDGVHVGTGAVVIQGIVIGSRCVIGAGSVVLEAVHDGEVVVGNPARRHSPRT